MTNNIENLNRPRDAFEQLEDEEGMRQSLVHIRIQQRTGRKTITTVQGVAPEYDLKKIVRYLKKVRNCNGTIVEHPEYGEVIQLTGDQRQHIKDFLCKMPLTKREVTPKCVSVQRIPASVRTDELQCLSNGSLANLVRQLSSLSKHAENIFTELFREAVKIDHRTNTLDSRLERLTLKATQLECQEEQVSIEHLHLTKHYRTNQFIDQGSLSRQTMPSAMADCYLRCEAPPQLDQLNQYRDSEIPALKMYTDPDYFYNLWKIEMLKDDVPRKHRSVGSRPTHKSGATSSGHTPDVTKSKRRPRAPTDHRQKYLDQVLKGGAIIDLPAEYHAPEDIRQQQYGGGYDHTAEPPRGMVPTYDDQGRPLHSANGAVLYSSGYNSGSQDSLQRHQRRQAKYNQQASVPTQQDAANQRNHHPVDQGYHEPSPAVTSQYMAAGYSLDAANNNDHQPPYRQLSAAATSAFYASQPEQQQHTFAQQSSHEIDSGRCHSNSHGGSTDSGSRRPSHAPPAPPPLAHASAQPPYKELGRLQLTSTQSEVANGGVLTNGDSPDLPPPPPPLGDGDLAYVQTANIASVRVTMATHQQEGGMPPPPSLLNKSAKEDGARVASPERRASAHKAGGLFNAALLRQIQDGKQLKKVTEKEEQERARAQTEQGQDVAAILKKRMEKVLGSSDSDSDDRQFNDDWSD